MKNFKKLSVFMFIFSFSLYLVACGNTDKNHTETEQIVVEEESVGKIIDRQGNEIDLPKKSEKIVSLVPSITETLIDLGLKDKIVAVDKYSANLEGIKSDIAVFDMAKPDMESLVALQPDILLDGITVTEGSSEPYAPLIEIGTFTSSIPTSTSIQGIIDDILFLGEITNTQGRAKEIVKSYKDEISNVVKKVDDYDKNVKKESKTKVYFEISPVPDAFTFGKNTFLNEMLDILKVENVFADLDGWASVSEEKILEKNPDVIFTNSGYLENPAELIKKRAGWNVIEAVKNNRVYYIDENSSSRPNENTIKAFKEMAKALYPEIKFDNE